MTKITYLAIAAAMSTSLLAGAVDNSWLNFRMIDNTVLSVASDNLLINYIDGTLHLTSPTVDQTIPVTEIRSMQLSSETSGIGIPEQGNESSVLEYFNAAGLKAGAFSSQEEAKEALPSGIYIVKSGEKSRKVIF